MVTTILALFIPLTAFISYLWPEQAALLFLTSAIGLVPASLYIEGNTERLAVRVGPTIGGMLNATFGNLPELFIGMATLRLGLHGLLKAQILGGIVVNLLFVVGLAMLFGGLRYKTQVFNTVGARTYTTLMLLASMALLFPSSYFERSGEHTTAASINASAVISYILLTTYVLYLLFTLFTHKDLIESASGEDEEHGEKQRPLWMVVGALLASSLAAVWLSDVLIESITVATETIAVNETFMGVIVLGTLGNVAGIVTAVKAARKDRMDLAFNVAIGSSVQQILFVVPVLVLASFVIGASPMDLAFKLPAAVTILLSVIIMGTLIGDGQSHWLKGAQLLALHAVLIAAILLLT